MLRLLCLLALAAAAPAALAQSPAAALAQARAQAVAQFVAQGLSEADAAYVVACAMDGAAPGGGPCNEAHVEALLAGDAAPPPEPTAPEAPPAVADVPDTSVAVVAMEGAPSYTFAGHAYVTPVSDDFAVLAFGSDRLVGGSWATRDDAPFSYVEVRLWGGLREGPAERHQVSLYAWGPGGARLDGPAYRVTSSQLTLTRTEYDADGALRAITGTLRVTLDELGSSPGAVVAERVLTASFEAVPGRIPAP